MSWISIRWGISNELFKSLKKIIIVRIKYTKLRSTLIFCKIELIYINLINEKCYGKSYIR
jgi:hypothetical protein